MAKRRVNNVTNGNQAAPKKEQAKKPVRKNRPAPPAEEVEVDEIIEDDEFDDYEEMEAEVKPSLWTRIKESKPVQTGKKIGKIGLAIGAGFALCKVVDKVRGSRSSDDDDYEDEYDDDSSDTE